MPKESLEQRRKRVRKIIARLKKTHPDARIMLKFSNALELLIALILSARTRDEVVNAVTPELFRRYRKQAENGLSIFVETDDLAINQRRLGKICLEYAPDNVRPKLAC